MRPQPIGFRLLAVLLAGGLIAGPMVPPAWAQGDGGPAQTGPEVTPTMQVGALAWMQGQVSFHTADQDNWSPAVVNYPVSTGDALWTQPGALAGLDIADTLIALAGGTELDAGQLQGTSYSFTLPQGETYLHVRSMVAGENYAIITPRGTVNIATPGRYEIAAGTTESPTLVTVLDGAARLTGNPTADVAAGQTAEITGDQAYQVQIVPAVRDDFLNAMLARERPAPLPPAVPQVVQQMPGAVELAEYGTWSQAPSYGQVWYPSVPAGWAPYRDGHWAYVQPWGWTWVDNDPWGFAPFHYGRWADIDGRWAWIPASVQAAGPPVPVYAPALVTFFGVGAAFAAGVATGALLSGSVGWVPLGPHEVYHPWFHAAPSYVQAVNIRHVTNITNISNVSNTTINNITINKFVNARAAVVVPAAAMATSRPIQSVARPVSPAQLAEFHPVVGRPVVPPTTATLGVTPAVARQVHAVPAPAGYAAPARPAAPGPAVVKAQYQAGHPAGRPQLRPATPGTATPVAVGHGVAPAVKPGTPGPATPATVGHPVVPALRAPGKTEGPPAVRGPGAVVKPVQPGEAAKPMVQTTARPANLEAHPVPPPAQHSVAPPAAVHPEAKPELHAAMPPPKPQVRVAAPVPHPVVHAAAPVPHPQVHAASIPHPPAPAPHPVVHAAAPAPHPAPQKKPGEK